MGFPNWWRLLGVVGGHGDHPSAQPEQLGAGGHGGPVGRPADAGRGHRPRGHTGVRCRRPLGHAQAPGRVEGGHRGHRHRSGADHMDLRAVPVARRHQHQQVGPVGPGHGDRTRRGIRGHPAHGGGTLALGDPAPASRTRWRHRRVRRPSSASSGAARAVGLDQRLGQRHPPASSSRSTRSTRPRPSPPWSSGTVSPTTPSVGQRGPAGGPGRRGSKAARTSVGRALLGQHLADRVAELELLVGEGEVHGRPVLSPGAARACARPPRCAGSRWCRRRWGRPGRRGSRRATVRRCRPPCSSASGPEQVEGGPVDGQVGLGPVDLVGAGLGADRAAVEDPGGRPQGVEPVGLGVHPGLGHRVGAPGGARRVGRQAFAVEVHQAGGGLGVAGRAAQAEPPLGAGRGHGHVPSLAHPAEHLVVGDEHVLEEDLGEPGLAVDLGDGPHGHPRAWPCR